MIDWPNALTGFFLGILATLVFWIPDRHRAARARRADAMDAWKAAAKEIELLLYRPQTTAGDIYGARVKYPIDSWRAILGPDSFRLLERVESAYTNVEHWSDQMRLATATQADAVNLELWRQELLAASTEFANYSREAQSIGYSDVVEAEQKAALRRDYRRHPLATWKRERRNRRLRAEIKKKKT